MQYADAAIREIEHCHPELRDLLMEFDRWSVSEGLPEATLTDLIRDEGRQIRIYVDYWRRVGAAYSLAPNSLSPEDKKAALRTLNMDDKQLTAFAMKRWTWHYVRCAADVRTRHYSQAQLTKVRAWWFARCQGERYELLFHDVHGPHLHVAVRDSDWRRKYSLSAKSTGSAP